jgi:hypothetical protein
MLTTSTKYGQLEIAESRKELDKWSLERSLEWLSRNDPNGEWGSYLDDPEWAQEELGELTAEDARDQAWEQMREESEYLAMRPNPPVKMKFTITATYHDGARWGWPGERVVRSEGADGSWGWFPNDELQVGDVYEDEVDDGDFEDNPPWADRALNYPARAAFGMAHRHRRVFRHRAAGFHV